MTQPRRPSHIVTLLARPEGYSSGPAILAELRRVVASGAVPPGSPIPLDDVAAFFGVSLIPVREALKTLLGEGLLEHLPRLGYTVTDLSQTELDELYLVRGALESAALEAAARQATPAHHAAAMDAHVRMGEAVQAKDPRAFQRASREFHEALLAASQMPRLLHMVEIAWNVTEPAQTMMRVTEEERVDLAADHEAMLDAFLVGDVAALIETAAAHHARLTTCVARGVETERPPRAESQRGES